jgi:hypothetical protein
LRWNMNARTDCAIVTKPTAASRCQSKTVTTSLSDLYAATADVDKRKKWFPKGEFALSSLTRDKYFRGSWNKKARLEIGFYARAEKKAQIVVQISKLAKKSDVERERAA